MTLQNYSNLTQRIIAALIAVPIVLFAIWYNHWTFFALFTIIAILTQLEFYKLLKLDDHLPLAAWGTFCGATIITLTFFVELEVISFRYYYLVVPLLTTTFFIKLYKKKDEKPFANLGYTFLGIIYVAMPFALLIELIIDVNQYKPLLVVGILLILWANDSGAYFAGRALGKRKLFERISPKKTWEGFIGGALLSFLVALLISTYFDVVSQIEWLAVAFIIVITGTLGDLVESLFKRSISIKDSGSVIPGHGGFLDRFDGLLLSLPFIVTFFKLFGE
ncbi:MAG: phosphatidate cytidylyltransferase [Spirosomataceae bacterium]